MNRHREASVLLVEPEGLWRREGLLLRWYVTADERLAGPSGRTTLLAARY